MLPITGRLLKSEDLVQCVPANLILLDCTTFTQAFHKNLTTNFRPKLHIYVQSGTSENLKDIELKFDTLKSQRNTTRRAAILDRPSTPPGAALFDRRQQCIKAVTIES